MFDIGWPELFVVMIVALLVIGPKDLPRAIHTVGKWVRKARGLAREFQSSLDDMVREAELEDLRKQVQEAKGFNLKAELEKTVDPQGSMRDALTFEGPDESGDFLDDSPKPAAQAAAPGAVPAKQAEPKPAETKAIEANPVAEMPLGKPYVPDQAGSAAAPEARPADLPAAEKRG